MLPALAFAEPQTQTPQAGVHPGAVAGWVSLVLGAASIATGTGFGIDLAVHSPARRFDEPLVTGVLLGAGVLLAAVGLYLILDDLVSSLTDAVFRR